MYVCTGGCGACIDEKHYEGGLKACGAQGCPHKGHPFEKRAKCSSCGIVYKEEEPHTC